MSDTSKCEKCGAAVDAGELVEHSGQHLCEDCYMDRVSPLKPCDPWAVHNARGAKNLATPELLPLQRLMLDAVTAAGAMAPDDLAARLDVQRPELDKQFAVLRHMELLRGFKGDDGRVYWCRF
ncbi:MAG: hypothetical protein JW781_10315 [Deltaproteobacteria bacterium]|nr:hypothetical protein [Candidatus Anaeroferrophillacea bacterium]